MQNRKRQPILNSAPNLNTEGVIQLIVICQIFLRWIKNIHSAYQKPGLFVSRWLHQLTDCLLTAPALYVSILNILNNTHSVLFSSSCILQCALGSFSLNLLGLHKSSALWMKKLIHKTRFYEHPSNLSSCVGNKTRSPHTHPMTTLQNPDIQIIFYLANDSNPLKKVAQHVGVPQEMAHMCAWKGEGGRVQWSRFLN